MIAQINLQRANEIRWLWIVLNWEKSSDQLIWFLFSKSLSRNSNQLKCFLIDWLIRKGKENVIYLSTKSSTGIPMDWSLFLEQIHIQNKVWYFNNNKETIFVYISYLISQYNVVDIHFVYKSRWFIFTFEFRI